MISPPVMLIAISVVVGFKREVRNQVIGFGSHIQLTSIDGFDELKEVAIAPSDKYIEQLRGMKNIKAVQKIVRKPGVIQTDNAFQGVIMKGVDETYDWEFFAQRMEGNPQAELADTEARTENWAMISKTMANKMGLEVGEKFLVYFVGERLKARKLTVSGIYQTTFAEYDKIYILTDAKILQQLNGWKENEYSMLELLVATLEQKKKKIHLFHQNQYT